MSIEEKVASIVRKVAKDLPDEYKNINLFEEGVLDSLAVMQLIGELYDEFDAEIDVDDVTAQNFDTVSHIAALIEKYKK